jgi:hypothetical protein
MPQRPAVEVLAQVVKPRAPRKKKEPPLGEIKDVAVTPQRKIRIIQ